MTVGSTLSIGTVPELSSNAAAPTVVIGCDEGVINPQFENRLIPVNTGQVGDMLVAPIVTRVPGAGAFFCEGVRDATAGLHFYTDDELIRRTFGGLRRPWAGRVIVEAHDNCQWFRELLAAAGLSHRDQLMRSVTLDAHRVFARRLADLAGESDGAVPVYLYYVETTHSNRRRPPEYHGKFMYGD